MLKGNGTLLLIYAILNWLELVLHSNGASHQAVDISVLSRDVHAFGVDPSFALYSLITNLTSLTQLVFPLLLLVSLNQLKFLAVSLINALVDALVDLLNRVIYLRNAYIGCFRWIYPHSRSRLHLSYLGRRILENVGHVQRLHLLVVGLDYWVSLRLALSVHLLILDREILLYILGTHDIAEVDAVLNRRHSNSRSIS